MKRFRLLLIALATVGFTSFYACGGGESDDQSQDSVVTEQPTDEPVIEEMPDSTTTVDSTQNM